MTSASRRKISELSSTEKKRRRELLSEIEWCEVRNKRFKVELCGVIAAFRQDATQPITYREYHEHLEWSLNSGKNNMEQEWRLVALLPFPHNVDFHGFTKNESVALAIWEVPKEELEEVRSVLRRLRDELREIMEGGDHNAATPRLQTKANDEDQVRG